MEVLVVPSASWLLKLFVGWMSQMREGQKSMHGADAPGDRGHLRGVSAR
jgi:hypothetical protein